MASTRVPCIVLVSGCTRADDEGLTVVTEVRAARAPRIDHHAAVDLFHLPGGDRECF